MRLTTSASSTYPALRLNNAPDGDDSSRVVFVRDRWSSQDGLLIPFGRMLEDHCRMLAGRQWDVWSDALGKFIDVTALFSDKERLWRERPVVNLLTYWFMLTHARMSENPPIVTFQPATSDRTDAMLAQTMDTVYKTLWNQLDMPDHHTRMLAWLIAGGAAYEKSYPANDPRPPAHPEQPEIENASDDPSSDIAPLTLLPDEGMSESGPEIEQGDINAPDAIDQPGLAVCALNPLQCRGEWGATPWHVKAWHIHRDYYTPHAVKARWGLDLPPDVSISGSENGPGYLERLMMNNGGYGSVYLGGSAMIGNTTFGVGSAQLDNYICVDEMWELPSPLNDYQGRLCVVTDSHVLYDGPRPFPRLKGASPIRQFGFVGVPGRPYPTTPMEFLTPLQRAYNRGWAQAMEHRSLMTNPMILVDVSATIDEDEFVSAPGTFVRDSMREGVPLIKAFEPPTLSSDFWRIQDMLYQSFLFLGNITGTEGSAPTDNASGELVTQLRANADRFIGPTMRGIVVEYARMAEDWTAMLGVLWQEPKLLVYAGEDSIPQTLAIEPELWQGAINAVPDVESMLPEGRGEKQAKVFQLWQAGWFGDPLDPATVAKVSPMMRFPNLNRAAMPGGVDAVTANHNLGKLLLGASPDEIPLFDAYKVDVHLDVTQGYIAASEFTQNDQGVQDNILDYVDKLKAFAIQSAAKKAQQQAFLQLAVSQAAADVLPPPPPMPQDGTGGNGAPPGPGRPSPRAISPESAPATPRPAGSTGMPSSSPATARATA